VEDMYDLDFSSTADWAVGVLLIAALIVSAFV
jgi:hypothetical protein